MNYFVTIDADIIDGQKFRVIDDNSRQVCRGCEYQDAKKIAEALELFDATNPPVFQA